VRSLDAPVLGELAGQAAGGGDDEIAVAALAFTTPTTWA
jgi:hypothetical protein